MRTIYIFLVSLFLFVSFSVSNRAQGFKNYNNNKKNEFVRGANYYPDLYNIKVARSVVDTVAARQRYEELKPTILKKLKVGEDRLSACEKENADIYAICLPILQKADFGRTIG